MLGKQAVGHGLWRRAELSSETASGWRCVVRGARSPGSSLLQPRSSGQLTPWRVQTPSHRRFLQRQRSRSLTKQDGYVCGDRHTEAVYGSIRFWLWSTQVPWTTWMVKAYPRPWWRVLAGSSTRGFCRCSAFSKIAGASRGDDWAVHIWFQWQQAKKCRWRIQPHLCTSLALWWMSSWSMHQKAWAGSFLLSTRGSSFGCFAAVHRGQCSCAAHARPVISRSLVMGFGS